MRIFIAGGSGAIGRRLVPLLVAGGNHVSGTTRNEPGALALRAAGATPHVVDVYDRERLIETVRGERPEVVVHQLTDLASGNVEANARLRIEGTRNLVDAARTAGVRRFVAQSIAWAYAGGDGPAVETDALDVNAVTPRARTIDGVLALERAVTEFDEHTILRYGLLYGPGTWYAKGGLMAEKALRGELRADQSVTSFVHLDDAASACALVLTRWASGKHAGGVFNVCDDEPAAGAAWVPEFARAVGAPEPPRDATRVEWARGASNRLARELLGLTLRFSSWREGFRTGL